MSEPVLVRRITPADWQVNRALRLQALADYPLGYLETLAQAQDLDDDAWRARAARGAEGGDSFHVLALVGERPVGNSVSFLADGAAWLAAVYVSPDHRGRGVLARLVQVCGDWVREQGLPALDLEVHEDNSRARVAYARLGFARTGDTRPYPLPAGGIEHLMRLQL